MPAASQPWPAVREHHAPAAVKHRPCSSATTAYWPEPLSSELRHCLLCSRPLRCSACSSSQHVLQRHVPLLLLVLLPAEVTLSRLRCAAAGLAAARQEAEPTATPRDASVLASAGSSAAGSRSFMQLKRSTCCALGPFHAVPTSASKAAASCSATKALSAWCSSCRRWLYGCIVWTHKPPVRY